MDSEGMRQGVWHFSSIHDEEKLESKGRFKNDKPWGRWKYYNEDEILIRKEKYKRKNGAVIIKTKFFYPTGRVEKEGLAKVEYNASNTHYYWVGEWKYYLSSGKLSAIKLFSKGSSEPEILMETSDD